MATSKTKPWKLLLTEGSERQTIEIQPSATLSDLYELAGGSSSVQLVQAIPRKDLPSCSNTTLKQAGLQTHDRILVFSISKGPSIAARAKSKPKTTKRATSTKIEHGDLYVPDGDKTVNISNKSFVATSPVKRAASKRAAAQAATASFGEVNRLIDEQEQKQSASKRTRSAKTTKSIPRGSTPHRNPRFTAASTEGRRLEDGAVVAAKRRRQGGTRNTQDKDPALSLLNAVNGSDNSNGARLIRAGWRQAVEDAFEQNKAMSRVAALSSGDWSVEVVGDKLHVSFSKGLQGRGYFSDEVDGLPDEILKSVVTAIHPANTEALRPQNLAILSPRVFWSVAHNNQRAPGERVDLGSALQNLYPELDWSFLRRRKQQLSVKARENQRQEEAREVERGESSANWDAAAEAIESVERAMGNLQAMEQQSRQTQLAEAASARRLASEFVLAKPTEVDLEELEECVGESSSTTVDKGLLATLLSNVGIRNWRELANQDAIGLHKALPPSTTAKLDHKVVQTWIDAAQARSLDEIMVEICEGDMQAVQMLTDCANSGTPKDLSVWRGIADALHNELGKDASGSKVTVAKLERWCERAHQALMQLDWLNDYATPLE